MTLPHWHLPAGTLFPSVCSEVPEADVSTACLPHRVRSVPFETPTLAPLFSTPAFAEHSQPRTVNKEEKSNATCIKEGVWLKIVHSLL